MDNAKVKGLSFPGTTNWEIIFIHGYTGGITDFADLPHRVHQELGASVWLPLLPGHGTSIDDLAGLTYENLILQVEKRVAKSVRQGKRVVLIGISFGAQAALHLASQYAVHGVVAIGSTHGFRFPLNLPGIGLLSRFKRKWKKYFTPREKELRAGAMSYDEILSDGFFICKKLRILVEANARHIHQPLLVIHSAKERLANPRATLQLLRKVSSQKIIIRPLENGSHNMFYSDSKENVIAEVLSFIKELTCLPQRTLRYSHKKVSAIVPAYNEAATIGTVLDALMKAPSIGEIIVIDDGSRDNTWDIVGTFPGVRRLKNPVNLGKGASMDRGVTEAKHDIIFFCDADLQNFKPEHAEAICRPVLEGAYDMFIGMRGNFMQRAITTWGLNSGERALHKELWRQLPSRYKHRYRIEAALNDYVRGNSRKGFGWRMLEYSQKLKESKYGFLRGTLLRWWMNVDVLYAYASRFILKHKHATKKYKYLFLKF